jgi:hypothetical protein
MREHISAHTIFRSDFSVPHFSVRIASYTLVILYARWLCFHMKIDAINANTVYGGEWAPAYRALS